MMDEMIKASVSDIPLLDGYLHDASFVPDDLRFDSDSRSVTLTLERICYERPERGKAMFIFNVIRFPWIESELTFSHVKGTEQKWSSGHLRQPGEQQMLLDLESEANTIRLRSHALTLVITVEPDSVVTITDLSEPSAKRRVTDFGKCVFRSLEEIDKLRIKGSTQHPAAPYSEPAARSPQG